MDALEPPCDGCLWCNRFVEAEGLSEIEGRFMFGGVVVTAAIGHGVVHIGGQFDCIQ